MIGRDWNYAFAPASAAWESDRCSKPTNRPQEECEGNHLRLHKKIAERQKDVTYQKVTAYQSLRCGCMFRVYPQGVTHAQTSQRVKGLWVMLYLVGLRYGALSLALKALGAYMSKSSEYDTTQDATDGVRTEGDTLRHAGPGAG